MEKTIKVQFFRLSPGRTTRVTRIFIARSAPIPAASRYQQKIAIKTAR
jgi:hypothetical protein